MGRRPGPGVAHRSLWGGRGGWCWLPGRTLTHLGARLALCGHGRGRREGWRTASQEEVRGLARVQPHPEGGGLASVTEGVTNQVS